ncbi:MAG: hypothetical protein ACLP3C_29730, partial [Mycobacterium sp.]
CPASRPTWPTRNSPAQPHAHCTPVGAAYNAVIEYLDHVVPVRGARTASDPSAARALRNITASGSSQSLTAQAFSMRQTL